MNNRFICFAPDTLMLAVTLGFTSCGPEWKTMDGRPMRRTWEKFLSQEREEHA